MDDSLFCIICNSILSLTNISIDKKFILNDSNSIDDNSKYKAYCEKCNVYSNLKNNVLLYNNIKTTPSKIGNPLYHEKLTEYYNYCETCKKTNLFKMFTLNNNDIIQKIICSNCLTITDFKYK